MVSRLGVPTQLVFAVQFRVAARATPLPTTNTTAIVVSSTIALLFNFITHSLSLLVGRLSLCETSLRFCVLSTLEKKCGLRREALHLPDGTYLVVHLAHLWLSAWHIFGVCTVAKVPRRQRLGELLGTPSTRSSGNSTFHAIRWIEAIGGGLLKPRHKPRVLSGSW